MGGSLVVQGLEYFSIHDKADNDNNHNLQNQGHESALNDFIEYSEVHFQLD